MGERKTVPEALRRLARKNSFLYILYNVPRLLKGYYPIFLDYPFEPIPRYGYGRPVHPELHAMFSEGKQEYREVLKSFLRFQDDLIRIPRTEPKGSVEPSWINNWLDGLDTFALYGFVAQRRPNLHLEIGSGYSTKLVRRAIRDHQLKTTLISIDPRPRDEIDSICDQVLRQALQDVDQAIFRRLTRGDILFLDGSHRSFMNSDVTVFFLEILPRLQPGVMIHLHDIELPYDYMPERAHWYYSEQYLLAASLLAGHRGYRVALPNAFVSKEQDVASVLDQFWRLPHLTGVPRNGVSFWIEKLAE